MKIGKLLTAAFAASCAMAPLGLVGCAGESAYVAYDEPPPPQEEVIETRPGYFYVHGHWHRDNGRWAWNHGYYERERPGYVYAEGHWERHDHGYRWHEGGWHTRGAIVIREHHHD